MWNIGWTTFSQQSFCVILKTKSTTFCYKKEYITWQSQSKGTDLEGERISLSTESTEAEAEWMLPVDINIDPISVQKGQDPKVPYYPIY